MRQSHAAADNIIIPVIPRYFDAKGLELLLKSIAQIRRQINPSLSIGGILLTMVDKRAKFTHEIIKMIETAYGENIHVYNEHIPISIRASESTSHGISIFSYDASCKVAAVNAALTKEVLSNAA
jgi:chromosome partitioning protein